LHDLDADGERSVAIRDAVRARALQHSSEGFFQALLQSFGDLGLRPEPVLQVLYPFEVARDDAAALQRMSGITKTHCCGRREFVGCRRGGAVGAFGEHAALRLPALFSVITCSTAAGTSTSQRCRQEIVRIKARFARVALDLAVLARILGASDTHVEALLSK